MFSPGCGATADFLHCFWACPLVHNIWSKVSTCIYLALDLLNILHPKELGNCLLGIFGDLPISKYAKPLLCILYFYARKIIFYHGRAFASFN